jgi:hypothetical protein
MKKLRLNFTCPGRRPVASTLASPALVPACRRMSRFRQCMLTLCSTTRCLGLIVSRSGRGASAMGGPEEHELLAAYRHFRSTFSPGQSKVAFPGATRRAVWGVPPGRQGGPLVPAIQRPAPDLDRAVHGRVRRNFLMSGMSVAIPHPHSRWSPPTGAAAVGGGITASAGS